MNTPTARTVDNRPLGSCIYADPGIFESPPPRNGYGTNRPEHERARRALAICQRCPILAECHADAVGNPPVGMIQGGEAYDDSGRPAGRCERCRRVILGSYNNARYCGKSCYEMTRLDRRRAEATT